MTQESALHIMKSGHNIFLTGAPGAGKTYVLNQYIDYLKDHGVEVSITAPTGIAASHIGGMTLHSFFGIGVKEKLSQHDIEMLTEKEYLWNRMKNLKVLIIDEVSMLSPDLFTSIDLLLRHFKLSVQPFGGVQVIFTGDFFQLPPISSNGKEERFIFQTELWKELDLSICYLKGSYRHEDEILLGILNEIRMGAISEKSMEHFRSRYQQTPEHSTGALTKLYTHNLDVDRINQEALDAIDEPPHLFEAHTTGSKTWIERIYKSTLFVPKLTLKKGALVLFIKNNYEAGYINGTLGRVIDFDSFDTPIIETLSGKRIKAERIEWAYADHDGKTRATIKQVPLRLAWAITIHKSQGMTLDAAEIDLSKAFEPGQGYVALSRIKSLEGLKLMGLNDTALNIDNQVLLADEHMRIKSSSLFENFSVLSTEQKEAAVLEYMKYLGGSHERGMEKRKEELLAPKKAPFEETKLLVEQEKTIEEIATERELKESTIYNHISQIMEAHPETDISYLQPPLRIIESVENAITDIQKRNDPEDMREDGSIKLKAIFEILNEEISYDEIKLSLLFLE